MRRLLSHHADACGYRCLSVNGYRLCRRCLFISIGVIVSHLVLMIVGLDHVRPALGVIVLFATPALVDILLEDLDIVQYGPSRVTVLGLLLGVGVGLWGVLVQLDALAAVILGAALTAGPVTTRLVFRGPRSADSLSALTK